MKNVNSLISMWFSVAAILISSLNVFLIFQSYSINLEEVFILASDVVLGVSGIMLFYGIIKKHRQALTVSAVIASCCCIVKYTAAFIVFARRYMVMSYVYSPYAVQIVGTLASSLVIISVLSFVFTAAYSSGRKSLKKPVLAMLSVTWLISVLTGGIGLAFLTSAFILLINYENIMDSSYGVKVHEVIYLSILTFGVYYVVWIVSLFKKISLVSGFEFRASKVVFYILIWPYRVYLNYILGEELLGSGISKKDRSVLYLALAVLPLSSVSLALIQRDINTLSLKEENNSEEFGGETE